MIIEILWIVMICIIIFASGFFTGYNILHSKVYHAMTETLDSVSIEKDGRDCVLGVLYACDRIDYTIKRRNKEDEED